jgi:hypothetical protein
VEVPHTRAGKEAVGIGEREREREFGDVYTQTAFLREAEVYVPCRGWARYVVGSMADINVARKLAPSRILGHSNTREVSFLY